MCGIFGIALSDSSKLSTNHYLKLVAKLYQLSESRGKESAGIHLYLPQQRKAWTLKGAQAASLLLKSKNYRNVTREFLNKASDGDALTHASITLAHSRLVTNGSAAKDENNQPVNWGPITIVHNGIIVNVDELWKQFSYLQRYAQVDTEILAALLAHSMNEQANAINATQFIFQHIKGAASIAWVHEASDTLLLASNTGDLYYLILPNYSGVLFASERFILQQILPFIQAAFALTQPELSIQWLAPNNGLALTLNNLSNATAFNVNIPCMKTFTPLLFTESLERKTYHNSAQSLDFVVKKHDSRLLSYNESAIRALQRCSKCVLPHTFPFIEFDKNGVCNYCHNHRSAYGNMDKEKTKQEFINSLAHYRKNNNLPDVLVPFSGGRDSSYGLHLICNEFGLKPVTFTYDWGMVTDLARRNIARMCSQLGIQNILVSADIAAKRKNIKNNVAAWLKKPDPGIIPLFMAGDKSFFKIVNTLKKQTGISLNLWCANPLENTNFKSGFCGIKPDFAKHRLDYLSLGSKAKLASYYASRFISNPGYLNTSLLDTFSAFLAYYFEPRRDFYFMFNHFIWEENEVNDVLLNQYDWETSPDSASTWRIGDGTAPFYNYIYNTAYGFSEFDTFRSNQIREGMIDRETALESICIDNRPREESLLWYLNTIGLDFNSVIKRINTLDEHGIHQ